MLSTQNYFIFFPGTCFEDWNTYICANNLLNVQYNRLNTISIQYLESCRCKQNHIYRCKTLWLKWNTAWLKLNTEKDQRHKRRQRHCDSFIIKSKNLKPYFACGFAMHCLSWLGAIILVQNVVRCLDLGQKYPKKAHEPSTVMHCRRGTRAEGKKELKVSETRPWSCSMTLLRCLLRVLISPISPGLAPGKAVGIKEAGILYEPRRRKGDVWWQQWTKKGEGASL